MEIHYENQKWIINANEYGGVLKNMYDDGYEKVNLTDIKINITFNPKLLDVLFSHKSYDELQNADLVNCFKLAYFLNIETYMTCLGKAIADRMKCLNKKDVLEMIASFD